QVADVTGTIGRYNDELARAKSDREIGAVVQKYKLLEESAKSLPIPQGVREQIRANRADAETWRESAKSAQTNIESAEAALRDGL
ncbi:MAG TPA: hypothetical protein VL860_02750, partial [Planctomycetota bacterium]|nr:hypothetical protein [Planctomycetota bacterium]